MVKYSLNRSRDDVLKVILLVKCLVVTESSVVLGLLLFTKRILVLISCRLLLYRYIVELLC